MLRKLQRNLFLIIIYITLVIFITGGLPADAYEKTKKFTGSYLTNFHIYQLGTYEFVMKLYGKNLSVSEPEFYDNTMQVILNNARVKIDGKYGKDTETAVKGDTSSAITKDATLETGVVIKVPAFIKTGDVVSVDTETGAYRERKK